MYLLINSHAVQRYAFPGQMHRYALSTSIVAVLHHGRHSDTGVWTYCLDINRTALSFYSEKQK